MAFAASGPRYSIFQNKQSRLELRPVSQSSSLFCRAQHQFSASIPFARGKQKRKRLLVFLAQGLGATRTFVAGATGRVGQQVVKLLLQKGLPVTALARRPSDAAEKLPQNEPLLEIVQGDVYLQQTLSTAVQGSKFLIIATGPDPVKDPLGPYTVDYQGVRNLLAAGRRAGIQKVVLVSSQGVDSVPFNFIIGALFFKKRGEEVVQRSGIEYVIVRPGRLLDQFPKGQQHLGKLMISSPSTASLPPTLSSASVLRSQVAEVCVEVLEHSGASNRILEVSTDWSDLDQ